MERPTLVSAASPRRSSRRTRTRALVLVPMLVLAFGGSALALVRFGTDDGGSDSGPGARGGGSASGTASGATTTQAARPTAGPAPTAVAPSRAGSGPGASSSGGGTGSLAGGSAPRAGADAPGAPATTGGTTPSLAGGGPGVGPSAVGPRLPGSVRFGGGGWALDLPKAAGWRQTAAQEVEGGRRLTVRLLRPDGARLIAVHLPGQAAVYGPWGGTRFAVRLPRVGTTVGRTFRGGRYAACRRGVCSALVVNGSVGGVLLVAASGSADASRRLVVRSARGLTVD